MTSPRRATTSPSCSASRSDIEVVGSLGSGEEVAALGQREAARRRAARHQHAGHGWHRHGRAAGAPRAECLDHHDERPGRARLSAPGDARRRARVPGQAVQLGRAGRLDPPGPPARAAQARPLRGQPAGAGRRATHVPAASRGPGRVVTFFAPKGGVGRTTLAVNFAVAAAAELGQRVALVDGGLQFGDVGVLLNLNPKNQSIADVAREMNGGDLETLDGTLVDHSSGIRVLMAPPSPEHGRAGDCRSPGPHRRRAAPDARPGGHRLDRGAARRDARLPRSVGHRADGAHARDHQHQEHPPVPGAGRAARLQRRRRSSWCSIAPIRPTASASRTSRARSAERSATPSFPTAGPSSSPSTVAFRSWSRHASRRSAEDVVRMAKQVAGDRARGGARGAADATAGQEGHLPMARALSRGVKA